MAKNKETKLAKIAPVVAAPAPKKAKIVAAPAPAPKKAKIAVVAAAPAKAAPAKKVAPAPALKKGKSKSPQLNYVCKVISREPISDMFGTISAVSDGNLTITHKKPRSKKMITSVIPLSQVLVYSNPDVAGEGYVAIKRGQIEYDSYEGVSVRQLDNGFICITSADGVESFIESSAATIDADDELATTNETARKAALLLAKAKAKEAAASNVAVAVADDSDEDDVEEDDSDADDDSEDAMESDTDSDEDDEDDVEEDDVEEDDVEEEEEEGWED